MTRPVHRTTLAAAPLRMPARLGVALVALAALPGCPEDLRCARSNTSDGAPTNAVCADDAGCYRYADPATGAYLFTDCREPDACASVRTYPDGARGPGGDYC